MDEETNKDRPAVGIDCTLDTVGLLCPAPIIKTAEKLKELVAGQVLEIVSDDPGVEVDIPAWCRSAGHEYLGIKRLGKEFRALVRKRAGKA